MNMLNGALYRDLMTRCHLFNGQDPTPAAGRLTRLAAEGKTP
jgi:hypothetical protein